MKFVPSSHNREVFSEIAHKYGLAYNGTAVATRDAEYTPVRGLTASPSQVDDNYIIGGANGHWVHILQRNYGAYGGHATTRNPWTICQVQLNRTQVPRCYLHSISEGRNSAMPPIAFMPIYELDFDNLTCPLLDNFKSKFQLYLMPNSIDRFSGIFDCEIQQMLVSYFDGIDLEMSFNKIYCYNKKYPMTVDTLDKMLRVIVWLAQRIDQNSMSKK